MDLSQWGEAEAAKVLATHAPAVKYHARRLRTLAARVGLDVEDLEAVGQVAVLEAVQLHSHDAVSIRTFVSRRVNQRLVDALRTMSPLTRRGQQLAKLL